MAVNIMRNRSRQGFTLIEMMIALLAGSFAVAGVYYLNGVSSRSFAEQLRVSETQMSLRSAMEQLRRDIARAGYLAAPNSTLLPDCGGVLGASTGVHTPFAMRGINITRDGSLDTATNTTALEVSTMLGIGTANSTRADTLDLWGNYLTPEVYLVDGDRSTTTMLVFQTMSEAFRRSFFDPADSNGPAVWRSARFDAAFPLGRVVRIENEGRFFFRRITGVSSSAVGNVNISFSVPLPFCFTPGTWSGVAPVSHVRYAIESDAETDFARIRTAETAKGATSKSTPGSRRTMLVRREMDDSATPPARIAETSRLVLDYAVELGIDYWNNAVLPPGRPAYTLTRPPAVGAAITNPEQVRSLVVTLSARSAEVDPKFQMTTFVRAPFAVAGSFDGPLRVFRVIDPANAALVLYARTRTLRAEVMLQNF
jgi:prepilin-type N-terminal cleavage/methylation domain-containing protein